MTWHGRPDSSTSQVEITNIGPHGLWILLNEREFFLSYEHYPWFRDARVKEIAHVELHHGVHLYWPDLDVDLGVDCLEHPERYPLIARESPGK